MKKRQKKKNVKKKMKSELRLNAIAKVLENIYRPTIEALSSNRGPSYSHWMEKVQ